MLRIETLRRALHVTTALGLALLTVSAGTVKAADTPAMIAGAPVGEEGVTVSPDGTMVTYSDVYFRKYNTISAEDQLKRIPGIQDVLTMEQELSTLSSQDRRGFGSGGDQILISGKRLTGKSNDVFSALRRIQASQVAEIQVIRGSVAGLDVRSEGLIVNIVLKQQAGSGTWEANASRFSGGRTKPGGRVSYTGDIGAFKYLLSAAADPRLDRVERTEIFFNPANAPFERQDERQVEQATDMILNANLSYAFANGDKANLNGHYVDEGESELFPSLQYHLGPSLDQFFQTINKNEHIKNRTWEVGGDYQHELTGGTLKGLFVANHVIFVQDTAFDTTLPTTAAFVTEDQLEHRTASERIVRGSYEFKMGPTQTVEIGAEGAINTVNVKLTHFVRAGTGLVQDFSIFNPDSKVQEKRGEAFASYSWQPQPTFLVEAAADVEVSRITQRGTDVSNARSFHYVKPRLDARYDITQLSQLRFKVQRTVSQLSFEDFVAAFTSDDNRTDVISAGNPELVPEKAWQADLTAEQRFTGDAGVMSLHGFYYDIQDHIERQPIRDTAGVIFTSGPGNIGDGKRYGVEAKGSLRLDRFLIDGAVVEGSVTAQDTSVTDPFTGQKRKFNNVADYIWSASFRQDIEWYDVSYGVTVTNRSYRISSDLDFVNTTFTNPDMNAFLEAKPFGGITVRLEANQVFRSNQFRERFQYTGNRANNVLRRREERDQILGRELTLRLRGVF